MKITLDIPDDTVAISIVTIYMDGISLDTKHITTHELKDGAEFKIPQKEE